MIYRTICKFCSIISPKYRLKLRVMTANEPCLKLRVMTANDHRLELRVMTDNEYRNLFEFRGTD